MINLYELLQIEKENFKQKDEYINANIFLDTQDYINKPYFKQYAIANMEGKLLTPFMYDRVFVHNGEVFVTGPGKMDYN